ncbi:MAG: sensor histidine kinase [Bacteroidota bacterium]
MRKKITYYNYFLVLSLVLITGYMFTSLFFLQRTAQSGEQAVIFGKTVKKTDEIIQKTYELEGLGYGYLLTNCQSRYNDYQSSRMELLEDYQTLQSHCHEHHLATAHVDHLNLLVRERVQHIDDLIAQDSLHTLENEQRTTHLNNGSVITDSIVKTLEKVRNENEAQRVEQQQQASEATGNATFMLSVFGVVMLFIVFVSFRKMKRQILLNEWQVKEIDEYNRELTVMNENLENFAYVASHDLNEPLRKIKTFGDMVESEIQSPQTDESMVKDHIHRMQEAASRMQQLIEDLLSYSRISRAVNIDEHVDLNVVVREVLSDLEVLIKEKNAEITVDKLPENLPLDSIQMRQLFQNLFSNALKFSKKNAAPKVKVHAKKVSGESLKEVEQASLIDTAVDHYWQIDVTDNGIGFDEKYIDKIFAVFQRLHGRSSYKGTGIGLSICKKICENHKGMITATSSEGEGATFSVFLPA